VVKCFYINPVLSADDAESFFNDPDVVQDWIYKMINLYPVWEKGIFGKGIRVRVNDEGVDYLHDEFEGRFDLDGSCQVFDTWFDESTREYEQHGTKVASIIGAAGNNSQCAVGVAPEVSISSCRVLSSSNFVDQTVGDGSYPAYKLDHFDISQNSFASIGCVIAEEFSLSGAFTDTNECPFSSRPDGPLEVAGQNLEVMQPCDVCDFPSSEQTKDCDVAAELHCQFYYDYDPELCTSLLEQVVRNGECTFLPKAAAPIDAIEKGAREGRDGKGIIYVYASGNQRFLGGNTNFEVPARYVIFVGAVGKDGQHARYSTPGASILLTAPAGDYDDSDTQTAAKAGGQCQQTGPGTSYSSPIVSGVVALMLEVNPDLTWRDVQGIMAVTSQPVTHLEFDDPTQTTNGAGLIHSNLYGFGIVDAMAAVTAAETWTLYEKEEVVTAKLMDLKLSIGDDPSDAVMSSLTIGSEGFTLLVENVEVDLYLNHLSRGHLQITLTSPDGTVSELTPGSIPENGQNNPWWLRTVRSWGEVPVGIWTLSIVDEVQGDVSNCADFPNWQADSSFGFSMGCDFFEAFPTYHNKPFMDVANSLLDSRIGEVCCICGGGTFNGQGICEDIILDPNQGNICGGLQQPYCFDGFLLPELQILGAEDSQGQTGRDACCFVGGGTHYEDAATFQDQLLGWELKVYGHQDPSKTKTPTVAPSAIPTGKPSADSNTTAPASAAFKWKTIGIVSILVTFGTLLLVL